jgi:hypothetical protein
MVEEILIMENKNKSEIKKSVEAGETEPTTPSPPKVKKELSVVTLPHDNDVMAQEMAELFDEDRVTHRHGGSEPEKD